MKKFLTRREMIREAGGGFGAIALASMLSQGNASGATSGSIGRNVYDLTPKQPHFAPKAKRAIFIYISGGPSTIDMFDPKPVLTKYDGKPAPFEIKGRALNGSQQIMASPWGFRKYGQSGRAVSDLLPDFAKVVDEVSFIRSMTTDRIDHSTAQFTFVTGRGVAGFPSVGSWISYGLGTENQNLPAFIALEHGSATIQTRAYGSAWLPPIYSGTRMEANPEAPMFDINRPKDMTAEQQTELLGIVASLNRTQKKRYPLDQDLESRIANYELAARMQIEALRVADISNETAATRDLYALEDKIAGPFGRNCLMARRLIESGVRFVTLISGTGGGAGWDCHNNIQGSLPGLCKSIDRGMYAMLVDLKQRGLLDDTLVVWSGEFGRLPTIEAKNTHPGRDHNPYGFTMWMAGGGVKAGFDYGGTDDLGYAALPEYRLGHSDVHATIQHLMGLDFKRNTFSYEGRDESLVGVTPARVVNEILS
ncbi:MAG: DUF1501 domain-containing protein [Bryobacteraceae bacterium]